MLSCDINKFYDIKKFFLWVKKFECFWKMNKFIFEEFFSSVLFLVTSKCSDLNSVFMSSTFYVINFFWFSLIFIWEKILNIQIVLNTRSIWKFYLFQLICKFFKYEKKNIICKYWIYQCYEWNISEHVQNENNDHRSIIRCFNTLIQLSLNYRPFTLYWHPSSYCRP
jgi:hypothetical protein